MQSLNGLKGGRRSCKVDGAGEGGGAEIRPHMQRYGQQKHVW